MACPNCGLPGGGAAGCGGCGLGRDPSVGKAFDTGNRPSTRSISSGTDCFPGDAKVLTPAGLRYIAGIRTGDEVFNLGETGALERAKVKRTVSHKAHSMMKVISTSEALNFFATRRHPVMTQRGWTRIKDLRAGDLLTHIGEAGVSHYHTVRSVERSGRVEPVFNLIVGGNHSFLVQGCVAHSFVYFRQLRTLANQVGRHFTDGRRFFSPTATFVENCGTKPGSSALSMQRCVSGSGRIRCRLRSE